MSFQIPVWVVRTWLPRSGEQAGEVAGPFILPTDVYLSQPPHPVFSPWSLLSLILQPFWWSSLGERASGLLEGGIEVIHLASWWVETGTWASQPSINMFLHNSSVCSVLHLSPTLWHVWCLSSPENLTCLFCSVTSAPFLLLWFPLLC